MKNSITSHCHDIGLMQNDRNWFPKYLNNFIISCMQLDQNAGDEDKNKKINGWYKIQHMNMDPS